MNWLQSWARYQLERWVLRGSIALVLLLIVLLGVIALTGGTLGYFLPGEHFPTFGSAIWWAVLRISDTGYLSDDTAEIGIRILSASLSVLGMTVTVGGIVAIVTQGMNRALTSLASATAPVPFRDHFVVIGWTDRTPRLITELLKIRRSKIVLLVEHVGPDAVRRLSQVVPKAMLLERVVLRSGSPERPQELARAACELAEAVIIPASSAAVAGDLAEGPRTLKTMLALRTLFERADIEDQPTVVVELVDRRLVPLVSSTLPGVHALPSDRLVARVMRLSLQHSSLVEFAVDVARPDEGRRISGIAYPELLGIRFREAQQRLQGGRVMGLLRGPSGARTLLIDGDETIQPTDKLLVLSEGAPVLGTASLMKPNPQEIPDFPESSINRSTRRILILGWNEAAPDLLTELQLEPAGRYSVDILANVNQERRAQEAEQAASAARIPVRQLVGDPLEVEAHGALDLTSYDRFLILADRSVPPDASDSRSLAIALALGRLEPQFAPHATILVELLEAESADVLRGRSRIVTPILTADVLASLAVSKDAADHVQHTFSHQGTYVTRVLSVPEEFDDRDDALELALLRRGRAFIQRADSDEEGPSRLAIVVEPAAR